LLTFARKQTVAPKVLDLNEEVDKSLKMLRRMIGEDIKISWEPSEDPWLISMDPSQLEQVLANLCVNARDAIAGVGTVVVSTANCTVDAEFCVTNVDATPGDYVRLTVADDGCGMERELLMHVFEPFFTTKASGAGTGLGLATVYGAVRQNNGFITVSSEPGNGTTFAIYLPRTTLAMESPSAPVAASPHGTETILLVEDEPSILHLVTQALAALGYTILQASGAREAVRVAREATGFIHLLLTDVVMPDMNGRDLANVLTADHPTLKLLFMSGYATDSFVERGVHLADLPLITKPFSVDALAIKVREVLDHAQASRRDLTHGT
jgi:CheY-like chemotaxis protein